ncbi:hypothetical protein [Burkholderia cenocepacia]|uniref:hypothetical protein n=1 Tax=Burkholderia cenocepacia TaxID=95486 RepID=UPI002B24A99C|nr:hypothetical protein [Burkholderia cenocepacia]MEB2558753.1 hypothetical protein [Burkholderia cenocepacia]
MQTIRSTLGTLEKHARAVAIGVTAVLVVAAIAWPYIVDFGRAVMTQQQWVIGPGFKVLMDGRETPIVGNDVCPREADPQKAYWLGGRPASMPDTGCVVIGPSTKEVRVQPVGGASEVWTVERRERDGFPAVSLKRANGEFVAQAK